MYFDPFARSLVAQSKVVTLYELAMALGVTHMDLVRPAGRKKPE
jgi:hypothetical protein